MIKTHLLSICFLDYSGTCSMLDWFQWKHQGLCFIIIVSQIQPIPLLHIEAEQLINGWMDGRYGTLTVLYTSHRALLQRGSLSTHCSPAKPVPFLIFCSGQLRQSQPCHVAGWMWPLGMWRCRATQVIQVRN